MYARVLEVLKNAEEPLTREEISRKANVPLAKTSLNLLRLREEGKVESMDKEGILHWSIKEEDENEKKMRQKGRFRDWTIPAGTL